MLDRGLNPVIEPSENNGCPEPREQMMGRRHHRMEEGCREFKQWSSVEDG